MPRPKGIVCNLCNGEFFSSSYPIHRKKCEKKYVACNSACEFCGRMVPNADMNTHVGACKKRNKGKLTVQQEMKKLITLVVSKGLDPCIVFSFSKRECEQYSMALENADFNNEEEKEQINLIYQRAIQTLSEDDQAIPMITKLPNILRRGIGIHHGGLIPIVKEVIELLF